MLMLIRYNHVYTMIGFKLYTVCNVYVLSYLLKLIKMRAKLANLNHCAVSLLSRAAVNLCWYFNIVSTPAVGVDFNDRNERRLLV